MSGMEDLYERVLDVLENAEIGPREADELAEVKEVVQEMKAAHEAALRIVKSVG